MPSQSGLDSLGSAGPQPQPAAQPAQLQAHRASASGEPHATHPVQPLPSLFTSQGLRGGHSGQSAQIGQAQSFQGPSSTPAGIQQPSPYSHPAQAAQGYAAGLPNGQAGQHSASSRAWSSDGGAQSFPDRAAASGQLQGNGGPLQQGQQLQQRSTSWQRAPQGPSRQESSSSSAALGADLASQPSADAHSHYSMQQPVSIQQPVSMQAGAHQHQPYPSLHSLQPGPAAIAAGAQQQQVPDSPSSNPFTPGSPDTVSSTGGSYVSPAQQGLGDQPAAAAAGTGPQGAATAQPAGPSEPFGHAWRAHTGYGQPAQANGNGRTQAGQAAAQPHQAPVPQARPSLNLCVCTAEHSP